jgi:mannose-6-phosphate isomerase-like protein (cupin superfamily)
MNARTWRFKESRLSVTAFLQCLELRKNTRMTKLVIMTLLLTQCLVGAEKNVHSSVMRRKTAPTWLHRYLPAIASKTTGISTDTCHYKPIFGAGDTDAAIVRSVARYGEVTIDSKGRCKEVSYPHEEQIYFVLDGKGLLSYGAKSTSVQKDDFIYIPPGVRHAIYSNSEKRCRLIVMGFKIPAGASIPARPKLEFANALNVKEQTDVGHPRSVLYRLLLGNRNGTHDKIDSGIVVTSLFLMDFVPGGTNLPHRHEIAEEIYLVLDGHGLIVAGGGMNGIEGLHPAKAGDAYFFRPNCTVGFYNSNAGNAHILAVRSWVPIPNRDYDN